VHLARPGRDCNGKYTNNFDTGFGGPAGLEGRRHGQCAVVA